MKQGIERESDGRIKSESVAYTGVYLILIALAVRIWLVPIHAGLWVDETGSYWVVSHGIGRIRQEVDGVPLYYYILFAWKSVFGASEAMLRLPSLLAMVGAVFALYRIARELIGREAALFAAGVFCIHPIVIFEAIDARPYAFGVLAVNCAVLGLLRWARTNRMRDAVAFGILTGIAIYFRAQSAIVLPAFLLMWWVLKSGDWKWKQLLTAVGVFAVMMIPMASHYMGAYRTSDTHVFAGRPTLDDLALTIAPRKEVWFLGALLLLSLARKLDRGVISRRSWLVAVIFGFVPLLLLFGISFSSMHVFIQRYRLPALGGIAMCWAAGIAMIRWRPLRTVLFTVFMLAGLVAGSKVANPSQHGDSWMDAISDANAATAMDHAPLLVCSDLVESNFLPAGPNPLDDAFYAPLSYYRPTSPVVPLPRAFNGAARDRVESFLRDAIPRKQRFVFIGYVPSWPTLDAIAAMTKDLYSHRTLGVYSGVAVVEFVPRADKAGKTSGQIAIP